MRAKNKLLFGVGINDASYEVYSFERRNGKYAVAWRCPLYSAWCGMLGRCYNDRELQRAPTYIECTVCSEWLKFSSFSAWMATQDYAGKQLDKDILHPGNKLYAADRCVFITQDLNKFLTDAGAARGEWPIGVSWNQRDKRFQAACGNPFTGIRDRLGYFLSPVAAHEAWRERKHKYACAYADIQDDPRVSIALRLRYLKTKEA